MQAGTLDSLISLSEDLPKLDTSFTATVAKIVDTLRSLLNNDPAKLAQHILVDERPIDYYLLGNWRWNDGRYGIHKSLRELVDTLSEVWCLCRAQSLSDHTDAGDDIHRRHDEGKAQQL